MRTGAAACWMTTRAASSALGWVVCTADGMRSGVYQIGVSKHQPPPCSATQWLHPLCQPMPTHANLPSCRKHKSLGHRLARHFMKIVVGAACPCILHQLLPVLQPGCRLHELCLCCSLHAACTGCACVLQPGCRLCCASCACVVAYAAWPTVCSVGVLCGTHLPEHHCSPPLRSLAAAVLVLVACRLPCCCWSRLPAGCTATSIRRWVGNVSLFTRMCSFTRTCQPCHCHRLCVYHSGQHAAAAATLRLRWASQCSCWHPLAARCCRR